MKLYALCVFFCFICAEALECGIKTIVDNSMTRAVSMCLSKNAISTRNNITPMSTKENTSTVHNNSMDENNSTTANEMKKRKARSSGGMKLNRQVLATTTTQPEVETEAATAESFVTEENCIVQCILSRMNLTNQKGFPDQERITNILSQNLKTRELKDFLNDTTEKCFQKIKEDFSRNSCDFSLELIRCLANEGKSNCGDWPAGDIPLFD